MSAQQDHTNRSTIRALIVDDERIARAELRRLLQAHPQIEVVAEASNAAEAVEQIDAHQPHLLFLDVQMPGANGLELANLVDTQIQIIFCTAHEGFAVEAFGVNALDYVLKPVNPERLAKAIARVKMPEDEKGRTTLQLHDTILLKFGEVAKLVRLDEIDRFDSIGNHAQLHTRHGKCFVLSSLNRIEQRLDANHFVRASRACIVRLQAIDSLLPTIGYGMTAKLRDGSEVEISRRTAQALRQRLDAFS